MATRVTAAEYEAAGGDPTKIPRLRAALEGAAEEAEETTTSATDLWTPEAGPRRIGGLELRPLSAGAVAILQKIGHPVFAGGSGEMTVEDVLVLLWVLGAPVGQLLDSVEDGDVKRQALEWSMGLSLADMTRAQEVAQGWLDECGTEAPGDGAGSKSGRGMAGGAGPLGSEYLRMGSAHNGLVDPAGDYHPPTARG